MVDKFREKLLWLLRVAKANGEEQLIVHAWKACIGKPIEGSNPSSSTSWIVDNKIQLC